MFSQVFIVPLYNKEMNLADYILKNGRHHQSLNRTEKSERSHLRTELSGTMEEAVQQVSFWCELTESHWNVLFSDRKASWL